MSMKCPQCGLVNFASAAECKRCQLSFAAEPVEPGGWVAPDGGYGHYGEPEPASAAGGAKLGKASETMAAIAILSMGVARYVHFSLTLIGVLLLLGAFVTGVAALIKLRRGDPYKGRRKAIVGIAFSGLILLLIAAVVPAVFIPNLLRAAAAANSLQPRDRPEWREHRSDAAGFAAQMPGAPTDKTESKLTPRGQLEITETKVEAADGSGCFVAFTDFSKQLPNASADEVLDAGLKAGVQQAQATLVNRRSVTLDGHPGVEADLLGPQKENPQDRQRMTLRIYWAKPKLYIVGVSAPEETRLDAERGTFLDSFRITPVS